MTQFSKHYEYTTERGSRISVTIDVEHKTETTRSLDGHEYTETCNYWFYTISQFSLNGKEIGARSIDNGIILIGYQGKKPFMAALPAEMKNDLYSAERDYYQTVVAPKAAKAAELDREYEKHAAMMRKAMTE